MNGFSNDELLAIGTRKAKLNLPISATDINRSIPYDESRAAAANMAGMTEEQLKDFGEGRLPLPVAVQPSRINQPLLDMEQAGPVEKLLTAIADKFNIRMK